MQRPSPSYAEIPEEEKDEMFDIGWVEMMVVAIVMIVIIGPKELPVVLHTMGRWIARIRAMARNFQESIEEMAQESGLDEVRREVDTIKDYSLTEEIEHTIDQFIRSLL